MSCKIELTIVDYSQYDYGKHDYKRIPDYPAQMKAHIYIHTTSPIEPNEYGIYLVEKPDTSYPSKYRIGRYTLTKTGYKLDLDPEKTIDLMLLGELTKQLSVIKFKYSPAVETIKFEWELL